MLGSGPRGARMTEVDVSDPAHMKVLRTEDVDGYVVDARLTGRTARVVVASYPEAVYGPPELRARPSGWLPTSTLAERAHRQVGHVARGRLPLGAAPVGLLRRRRADRLHRRPRAGPAGRRRRRDLHERRHRLRVAVEPLRRDPALGRRDAAAPTRRSTASTPRTRTAPAYSASGAVPGTLLNQFAMSEDKGVLRAATTVGFGPEAREPGHDARRARRRLRPARPGRRARPRRADLRGPLHRRRRLRRHVPPDRPALHARPVRPRPPARGRRAEDPRLLRLPAPGRRGPAARRRPGGDRRRPRPGPAAVAVRRLRPRAPDAASSRRSSASAGRSSAAEWDHHAFLWWPATKLAVLPIDSAGLHGRRRLPRRPRARDRRARPRQPPDRSPAGRRRSAARSSSARACSRSPTSASRRAGWRASPAPAGRRSRSRPSRRTRSTAAVPAPAPDGR